MRHVAERDDDALVPQGAAVRARVDALAFRQIGDFWVKSIRYYSMRDMQLHFGIPW